MENNISVRLEKFIEYKKIDITFFCKQCGFSTQSFYRWKNGLNSFTKITKAFPEINAEWLFNGNGSMLKDESIIFHETESEYGGCKLCKEKDIQIQIYLEYINTLKEKLSEHQKQCEKRRAV
jgi:hypothetical protein